MRITCVGMTIVALAVGAIGVESQSTNQLIGVWKVAEIIPPSGAGMSSPPPTMYIFTARHYSHVSVTSAGPRPNHTGPNLSEQQRLEMWEPFTATAGVYDVSGNELTIRPTVAKNPGFMLPGSFTTFRFDVDGKDIWIRATRGPGGPIAEAVSNRVRLVRLE